MWCVLSVPHSHLLWTWQLTPTVCFVETWTWYGFICSQLVAQVIKKNLSGLSVWVVITRFGAQIQNMQQRCACLMTDCEYDTFCHLCDGQEIHIHLKVRASCIKTSPHTVIFLCGGFVISFYVIPSISTWLLTSSYFTFSAGKTAVWFTNQPQAAQPRRLTLSFKTNPFNLMYLFF